MLTTAFVRKLSISAWGYCQRRGQRRRGRRIRTVSVSKPIARAWQSGTANFRHQAYAPSVRSSIEESCLLFPPVVDGPGPGPPPPQITSVAHNAIGTPIAKRSRSGHQSNGSSTGALYTGAFTGISAADNGVVVTVKASRTADPTAKMRRMAHSPVLTVRKYAGLIAS